MSAMVRVKMMVIILNSKSKISGGGWLVWTRISPPPYLDNSRTPIPTGARLQVLTPGPRRDPDSAPGCSLPATSTRRCAPVRAIEMWGGGLVEFPISPPAHPRSDQLMGMNEIAQRSFQTPQSGVFRRSGGDPPTSTRSRVEP